MDRRTELQLQPGVEPQIIKPSRGMAKFIRRQLSDLPKDPLTRRLMEEQAQNKTQRETWNRLSEANRQEILRQRAEEQRTRDNEEKIKAAKRIAELDDYLYGWYPDRHLTDEDRYASEAELRILQWKIAPTQKGKESRMEDLRYLIVFRSAADRYLHQLVEGEDRPVTRLNLLKQTVLTDSELANFGKMSAELGYGMWRL